MSEEETKVTMKIPLFEEGEIEKIDSFTSEIAREINEKVVKEKNMIIAQRLIHNLQERIDEAIRILNSAKNHYDNDKTNWAIERTLRVLKGSDKSDNS